MSDNIPSLMTVGRIAAELGVPNHRIEYVLKTRTDIVPAARAGIYRLYDRKNIGLIQKAIECVDKLKSGWGAKS